MTNLEIHVDRLKSERLTMGASLFRLHLWAETAQETDESRWAWVIIDLTPELHRILAYLSSAIGRVSGLLPLAVLKAIPQRRPTSYVQD